MNNDVIHKPVKHGCRQRLVIGKGTGPLAKGQIARQDQAPFLIALGYHIEKQVCFLTPKRQVAYLIDHQ